MTHAVSVYQTLSQTIEPATPRRAIPAPELAFGPIGIAAARAVKGDIEKSIERFESLYARS